MIVHQPGGGIGVDLGLGFAVWVLRAEMTDVDFSLTVIASLTTIGTWFSHAVGILICDFPISNESLWGLAISPKAWFHSHVILLFEQSCTNCIVVCSSAIILQIHDANIVCSHKSHLVDESFDLEDSCQIETHGFSLGPMLVQVSREFMNIHIKHTDPSGLLEEG